MELEPAWNLPDPITVEEGVPQTFDVASWVTAPYPLLLSLTGTLPAGFSLTGVTLSWDGTGPSGDYSVDNLFKTVPDLEQMVDTITAQKLTIENLQHDVTDMTVAREAEQAQDDQAKSKIATAEMVLAEAKALL